MQFPGWVSAVLDLGSNFGAYYSEGHSNPRLDPLVSWCIVQLPSMKPFLGAMTNLYHFNYHLEQRVIHIPSAFTSKTSVTEWIGAVSASSMSRLLWTGRFSPSYQAWIIRPCCQPINEKIIIWARYSQSVSPQTDRYPFNWHYAPHRTHNYEKFSSPSIPCFIMNIKRGMFVP